MLASWNRTRVRLALTPVLNRLLSEKPFPAGTRGILMQVSHTPESSDALTQIVIFGPGVSVQSLCRLGPISRATAHRHLLFSVCIQALKASASRSKA